MLGMTMSYVILKKGTVKLVMCALCSTTYARAGTIPAGFWQEEGDGDVSCVYMC